MPTTESWVLDGVPLTSGAFTLMELVADPPRERQDWITAADSESAALFRQPLHENRKITMKLRVTAQASMNAALDQVGALVDKLRKASSTTSGVSLVWTAANASRTGTFTVLAGEITGMPISLEGDGFSWLLSRPIISIELTCDPYGLGTETLTSTASSSTPYVEKEITGVTGDVPALGRIIVTDTATQSRRHVEWGLEGPLTYNASTSLLVDSDSMVTSGFAGAQTTRTGAYDPNATGNSTILATLGSTGSTTAICGTGNLSHVGTFRVKARIQTVSNAGLIRFSWRSLDGPMAANEWVYTTRSAEWEEVDLGTITIPAAKVGTQRWTGQIEAQRTSFQANADFYVDYLILVPVSDGYGKARAIYSYAPGVVSGYDAFTSTTAGSALNGRTAPAGGTWATSGDTGDLLFDDSFVLFSGDGDESLKRSTSVAETSGRFAILGSSSYTDVQVEVSVINFSFDQEASVIARWTDSSNYLRLRVPATLLTTPWTETAYIEQVVAGVVTVLGQVSWSRTTRPYRYRLIAYASGLVLGTISSLDGVVAATITGSSSALATGGTLATGKPGFRDRSTGTSGSQRNYNDVVVSTPSAEPIVLYSGRNMQIRYDETFRQDSTGTYTGRPQSYRGGRFLVPVGTSRVLVKARRNDIEAAADSSVTDATQIQVGWTPRFLAVPR